MLIYSISNYQNRCVNFVRKQPGFSATAPTSVDLATELNKQFDTCVTENTAKPLLEASKAFKALGYRLPTRLCLWPALPDKNTIQTSNVAVTATKNGHIEVRRKEGTRRYHLLIPTNELTKAMLRDPFTSELIGSRGIRFTEPDPQEQWTQVLTPPRVWPPDRESTLGPMDIAVNGKETMLHMAPTETVGKVYGTKTQSIVTYNPTNNAWLFAFQLENKSDKQLNWAPWPIAPFRTVPGGNKTRPSTVIGFPVAPEEKAKLTTTMQPNGTDWTWSADGNTLFLAPQGINKTSRTNKLTFDKTNWSIVCHKGWKHAILLRSLYQHKDQFQICCYVKPYAEVEFTGPQVPPGEKSTVLFQMEFVPLSWLFPSGKIKELGIGRNLRADAEQVAEALGKKLN